MQCLGAQQLRLSLLALVLRQICIAAMHCSSTTTYHCGYLPTLQCSSKVSECNAGLVYQSNSISLHLWCARAPVRPPSVWLSPIHVAHADPPPSRPVPQARFRSQWHAQHAMRACGLSSSQRGQHRLQPAQTRQCRCDTFGLHSQFVKQSARSLSASLGMYFTHVSRLREAHVRIMWYGGSTRSAQPVPWHTCGFVWA